MEKVGKRDRSNNWDKDEKYFLMELLEENIGVEAKGCTLISLNKRKNAWQKVLMSFAAKYGPTRSLKQLKEQWGRMKLQAKKEDKTARDEAAKTGGGAQNACDLGPLDISYKGPMPARLRHTDEHV